jgi:hypothetical protein
VIGLIAASFGTVVYNGFYCQPKTVLFYSITNLTCGAAGSILPFQKWFNQRQNKVGPPCRIIASSTVAGSSRL